MCGLFIHIFDIEYQNIYIDESYFLYETFTKITLKSGMYISTRPSRSSKERNESYELVLYTIGNLRPFSTATAIASTT